MGNVFTETRFATVTRFNAVFPQNGVKWAERSPGNIVHQRIVGLSAVLISDNSGKVDAARVSGWEFCPTAQFRVVGTFEFECSGLPGSTNLLCKQNDTLIQLN